MAKFNKKKTIIKDLQDFIFLIIFILIQKHIKDNKKNILYKKFKILKTCFVFIDYI